jgi:hypothetical protein
MKKLYKEQQVQRSPMEPEAVYNKSDNSKATQFKKQSEIDALAKEALVSTEGLNKTPVELKPKLAAEPKPLRTQAQSKAKRAKLRAAFEDIYPKES